MRISDWSSDVCSSDLEAVLQRGDDREAIVGERCCGAGAVGANPVAEEIGLADRAAEGAEGMNVAVTRAPPIHEFYAEFEGGLRRLHKLGFVEPEEVVEILHLRSEEHTSELQSLMRISYAVFCLKKKNTK